MGLVVNRIRLDILTQSGPYGFDLRFDDGLNVIRADNTCGKSTCAIALLYALGLEGMIQAGHDIPLPDVAVSRLLDDGEERIVRKRFRNVSAS